MVALDSHDPFGASWSPRIRPQDSDAHCVLLGRTAVILLINLGDRTVWLKRQTRPRFVLFANNRRSGNSRLYRPRDVLSSRVIEDQFIAVKAQRDYYLGFSIERHSKEILIDRISPFSHARFRETDGRTIENKSAFRHCAGKTSSSPRSSDRVQWRSHAPESIHHAVTNEGRCEDSPDEHLSAEDRCRVRPRQPFNGLDFRQLDILAIT